MEWVAVGGDVNVNVNVNVIIALTFTLLVEDDVAPPASQGTVEARVDIKAFSHFLNGYQFSSRNVLLSIAQDKAVVIFILHDEVALTVFMPVISEWEGAVQ